MLTPEQAAADRRAERALRDAEVARLRRGTTRRRAAEALRSVASRLEPTTAHTPARAEVAVSDRPELVGSRS
jgi:hypothetical protein